MNRDRNLRRLCRRNIKKMEVKMLYWLNGGLVDEETYVLYLEATIRNVIKGIEEREIRLHLRKNKRFREHKEMLDETIMNINKNLERKIERLKKGEGTKIEL